MTSDFSLVRFCGIQLGGFTVNDQVTIFCNEFEMYTLKSLPDRAGANEL